MKLWRIFQASCKNSPLHEQINYFTQPNKCGRDHRNILILEFCFILCSDLKGEKINQRETEQASLSFPEWKENPGQGLVNQWKMPSTLQWETHGSPVFIHLFNTSQGTVQKEGS